MKLMSHDDKTIQKQLKIIAQLNRQLAGLAAYTKGVSIEETFSTNDLKNIHIIFNHAKNMK